MKCKFFRFPGYYNDSTIESEINVWLKGIGLIDVVNITTSKSSGSTGTGETDLFIFYRNRREKLEELDRLSK